MQNGANRQEMDIGSNKQMISTDTNISLCTSLINFILFMTPTSPFTGVNYIYAYGFIERVLGFWKAYPFLCDVLIEWMCHDLFNRFLLIEH